MKDERKLNKLVQEQDSKNREEILERLHEKHPELSNKQKTRAKFFSWQRFAVAACSMVLLVCAIVIPSVVLGGGNSDLPIDNDRFCSTDEYSESDLNFSLKEYNQSENKNVLFFDWYDIALECNSSAFFDIATNEVLGVSEHYITEEPERIVDLYAISKNIALQGYSTDIEQFENNTNINDVSIYWRKNDSDLICTFAYGEYRYIVKLCYEQNETLLFELVEELLG